MNESDMLPFRYIVLISLQQVSRLARSQTLSHTSKGSMYSPQASAQQSATSNPFDAANPFTDLFARLELLL
jgi:hypothetical protein